MGDPPRALPERGGVAGGGDYGKGGADEGNDGRSEVRSRKQRGDGDLGAVLCRYGGDYFFGRVGEVGGGLEGGELVVGGFEDFAGFFYVGAFETDDDGDFEADFAAGGDEGLGD